MATDRAGDTIATGQVYALAGTVRRIDGDTITIVVGQAGYEQTIRVHAGDVVAVDGSTHTHPGPDVSISSADWIGSLVGSGVATVQQLADWIDINLGGA